MSDELVALVSRLVSYDSAAADGVLETAGFIEGWLDSRGIQVESDEVRGANLAERRRHKQKIEDEAK